MGGFQGDQQEEGRKERFLRGRGWKYMAYVHGGQHIETQQTLLKEGGGWEHNGGHELGQGTLYTCIELSQRDPLI
jgi:hypothetical protein